MRMVVVCALLAALAPIAAAGQIYQAPYGPGGSWNLYEPIDVPATWIVAHETAISRTELGIAGHLADIQSAAEHNAVHLLGGRGNVWIGLTDREGVVSTTSSGGLPAPQESNNLPDPSTQGWAWTSGAPLDVYFWGRDEPLDFFGAEDAVHIRDDGLWNDLSSGMLADEPIAPERQPGTSADEGRAPAFHYVIEYPTASARMLDKNVYPVFDSPDLMPANLPGIHGGDGFMGVTDIFPGESVLPPAIAVAGQIARIVDGDLTPVQVVDSGQTITASDVTDRSTNPSGGRILAGTPNEFPGGGGDDFISIGKAWVQVPETGTYTVQVHSDDGFVLQMPGNPFVESRGNGTIQDGMLVFPGNTVDSNTLGAVALTAGVHELKFYMWETSGGAFWEISTAQGRFPANASYLGIGDETEIAQTSMIPPVRLVGHVTVANVIEAAGGASGDIEQARQIIDDALANDTALVRNDVDLLIIKDHDTICCDRPGSAYFDKAYVWPANDPLFGGTIADHNNFSSGIFGQLSVDDGDDVAGETLQITIGMFSADGGQFHIAGVDFHGGNGNAKLSFEVDGDVALTYPNQTGNSNALGLVELTEGVVYDFDGHHFENRGDSGFEVFAALGNHLGGLSNAFVPLQVSGDPIVSPGNRGWMLVAEPDLLPGDYNRNGAVDADDADLQAAAMRNPHPELDPFDENDDGRVDRADRLIWLRALARTWFGDANFDGEFNSGDLVAVFRAGKYESDEIAGWAEGDWNGDLRFGSGDLVAAFGEGGYERGRRARPVPEPGALWVVFSVVVAIRRGHKRRSKLSADPGGSA